MSVIASWEKVYGVGINNLGTAASVFTDSDTPRSEVPFTHPFNMPGWFIGGTASSEWTTAAGTTSYLNGVGDWWQIPFNNTPNLDPGQEIIEKEKALGKPYRDGVEYQAGVKASKTTLEMDVNAAEIIPFLWAFCGSMGSADGTKIFIPYVKQTSTATYSDASWNFLTSSFSTLMEFDDFRDFDYAGDEGVTLNIYEYIPSQSYVSYLTSAVPASMNFSSAENEALTVSMEVNGRSVETADSWESNGYSSDRPAAAISTPCLHQDGIFVALISATPDFGSADHDFTDSSALSVKSFSLNCSTNPGIDFFDSQNIQGIVNQRFSGTVEFQIQWDGTDVWKDAHENNEYVLFNALWEYAGGTNATDGSMGPSGWGGGDFGIGCVFRVTNCERTNEAQVMENITGEIVAVSTYTPLMFKVSDGVTWDADIQD